jgi:hypothetical protein
MSGSPVPSSVDLSASSQTKRRLRYSQVRGVNTLDYVEVVHDLYEASDIPTAVSAGAWSDPVNVQGYDAVYLFVDFTKGAATPSLTIKVEAGFSKNGTFFTRATSFGVATGDATAVPSDSSPIWSGGDGQFVIKLDALGHFMRFQPILSGASTGSRVTIMAQRVMLST